MQPNSQGDVDVVPQKAGKADVPAPPELAHAAGEVGAEEVLVTAQTQQVRHADGQLRIAGEVEIDVERIGRQRPDDAQGVVVVRLIEGVVVGGKMVRKALFQKDAPAQPHAAVQRQRPVKGGRAFQLGQQALRPLDGPAGELGEKAGVGKAVEGVLLGGKAPLVHRHQIGDVLEHEEADAHRHEQVRKGGQRLPAARQRGQVFEARQGQHSGQHTHRQGGLAAAVGHPQAAEPAGGGDEHQRCERLGAKAQSKVHVGRRQHPGAQAGGQRPPQGEQHNALGVPSRSVVMKHEFSPSGKCLQS